MKEMKSLDLNGTKYDSFVDQTARESIEKIELTPGPQGEKGDPGADGYTPVRGTDYWTEEDIAEIQSYVDNAILNGAW